MTGYPAIRAVFAGRISHFVTTLAYQSEIDLRLWDEQRT